MTEEGTFQRKFLKWLELKKLYAIKQSASGLTKTGIPDVIINADGMFLAVELKKEKGITSPLQHKNINDINNGNGIAISLRPSQFDLFKLIIESYLIDKTVSRYDVFKGRLLDKIGSE